MEMPFEEGRHAQENFVSAVYEHDCQKQPEARPIISHYHRALELIVVLKGAGCFFAAENSFLLREGESLLIPSQTIHSGSGDRDSRYVCILFNPSILHCEPMETDPFFKSRVLPYLLGNCPALPVRDEWVRAWALRFLAGWSRKDSMLLCISRFYELMDEVVRVSFYNGESAEKSGYVQQAIRLINAGLCGPLTSAGLAERLNLNHQYFCKCFKTQVGVSPVQYIHLTRIRLAQQYLLQNNESIEATAQRCGFENGGYFSRIFRRVTGENPGAWRARMLNIKKM